MFAICYICLRTKLKLIAVDDTLEGFYQDLCDYNQEVVVQFCTECAIRLRNYYNFKSKCHLAVKTLKNWKRTKASLKTSIHLLHRELPQPNLRLSLCSKNNFKVYFYQAADVDVAAPIEISNSRHPHIVTLTIPKQDNTENKPDTYIEIDVENVLSEKDIKQELSEVKAFDSHLETLENFTDDVGTSPNESNIMEDDTELNEDDDIMSDSEYSDKSDEPPLDSDSSIDEILARYNISREELEMMEVGKPKKIKKARVPITKEELKDKLTEKFTRCGEVKDDDGNVIDADIVLSSLERLSSNALVSINKICAGPGTFSTKAIGKLSDLQRSYAKFDIYFTTQLIHDEAQIRAEFEKRRSLPEYVNSSHRCESCLRGFKDEGALHWHMKEGHDITKKIECYVCKMRFTKKYVLNDHFKSHNMFIRCKLCPFVTHNRSTMQGHHKRHQGETYICEICGEVFRSKSTRYAHYNKYHDPEHTCELCALALFTSKGLQTHKSVKHQGVVFVESENNKKCEECNITFISDYVYQIHYDKVHGENKSECRERIIGKRPFSVHCPLCDCVGLSTQSKWLWRHHKEKHPDVKYVAPIYVCEACGKSFNHHPLYEDHLNTHTGERPYKCTMCPKRFPGAMNLKLHVSRHLTRDGPLTHVCAQCGDKFTSVYNLNNHRRVHITKRPYQCDMCKKRFVHKYLLRTHITEVHFHIRKKRIRKPRKLQ